MGHRIIRDYGGEGTVHGNEALDVEVDEYGDVVAVWFRCQLLAFRQTTADPKRAAEMNTAYSYGDVPGIDMVSIIDEEK